ncbi:anti-sigma factor family protein [Thermogemmatispora carboxidivorans]|uniref:anti-sigma factor family protein n=1 Tax=Thermogemmatispora carboxidivorans TaxID=1382306 RepID=UPI00138E0AE3|nr:zf-HC2 domain-containing protein [Thermogemmatispora carboxidivorans]
MAQDHQEHPTLEQLSAYLDGALSSEEGAFCAAHLPHCASCRSELASLRLTRDLLRTLPRATPPRTFTLTPELLESASTPSTPSVPAQSATASPEAAPLLLPRQQRPAAGARAGHPRLHRFVRVLSTLAAVIALALLLSGLLVLVQGSNSSSSVSTVARPAPAVSTASSAAQGGHPRATATPSTVEPHGLRPGSTAPPASSNPMSGSERGPSPTASLEALLSAPVLLLLLGGLLLIVSLVGLLLTRRAGLPSWPHQEGDKGNRQATR